MKKGMEIKMRKGQSGEEAMGREKELYLCVRDSRARACLFVPFSTERAEPVFYVKRKEPAQTETKIRLRERGRHRERHARTAARREGLGMPGGT